MQYSIMSWLIYWQKSLKNLPGWMERWSWLLARQMEKVRSNCLCSSLFKCSKDHFMCKIVIIPYSEAACLSQRTTLSSCTIIQIIHFKAFLFSVRGYLPASPDAKANLMEINIEQETLRELSARKQVELLNTVGINYQFHSCQFLSFWMVLE